MKHLRRKLIGSIVILLIIAGGFGIILFHTYQTINQPRNSEENRADIRAIQKTAGKALDLYRQASESVDRTYQAKAELTAASYRNHPDGGYDEKPLMLQGGAVIKVDGGKVTVPEGFPRSVTLDAGMFTKLSGFAVSGHGESKVAEGSDSGHFSVYYSQIRGPYYYIEWEDEEESRLRKLKRFDIYESLAGIEEIYNADFVLFDISEIEKQGPDCKYSSREMKPYVAELEEKITDLLKNREAGFDPETPIVLKLGNVPYRMYIQQNEPLHVAITYLFPQAQTDWAVMEQTGFLIVVFLFICTVFLVWFLSVLWVVRNHTLSDKQKSEFSPKRVKRVSRAFVIIGGIVILAAAVLSQCLFRLYDKYEQVGDTIDMLQQKIGEYGIQKAIAEETERKTYEKCTESIAELLSEHPELKTPEQFQIYCDILGTDYLMLFDKDGREIVTNSEYRGLSLSRSAADSSYDFRRLLAGVPVISHDVETDSLSGIDRMMVGARVTVKDETEGPYQAILMAVPASLIAESDPQTASDIMTEIATDSMLIFSMDPQSQKITAASMKEIIGEDAVHEGIPPSYHHDDLMDFLTINGVQYYCEAQMGDDGQLYFCAAEKSGMYSNVTVYALICAGLSMVLMVILALFEVSGYEKDFKVYSARGDSLKDMSNEIDLANGKRKWSVDPSKRWLPAFSDYGDRTPIRNALIAVQIILAFGALLTALLLFAPGRSGRMPLFTYILTGQWARGINLFAVTSILILLLHVIAVLILVKLLIRIISTLTGTRGETICRLLLNLSNYIAAIVFLFFALQYIGIDVTTLLASLGLLTFAISLGAKDLLTDILAGISIIFEGNFQVGDIIEINGYWGRVLEVGVRTTKLEGLGGNIKIIGNRDINNVMNKTRKNSWYAAEFGIPFEQIKETEEMLLKGLPEIGKKIPEIISGPYYKGIESFAFSAGKSVAKILIIAECSEHDYRYVQHELNHALAMMFGENNIPMM
ncbi:MAG: mechanosensitive ion channel [Clostridia bacterium]|nr:mechanosensitive ion channel [Clostridia bacterium]